MRLSATMFSVHRISLMILIGAIALSLLGCSGDDTSGPWEDQMGEELGSSATSDSEERAMSELNQTIIGIWEDDYKGKRSLTVYDDGTATMVVEPSGLNAMLVGRLRFEETWSIDDGHITMTVTGGEPAEQVKLICQMMGDIFNG